ncbi:MAG: hypothetical protein ACJAYH_002298 [Celeribacter sp.]|jgi:hypothetical protein
MPEPVPGSGFFMRSTRDLAGGLSNHWCFLKKQRYL